MYFDPETVESNYNGEPIPLVQIRLLTAEVIASAIASQEPAFSNQTFIQWENSHALANDHDVTEVFLDTWDLVSPSKPIEKKVSDLKGFTAQRGRVILDEMGWVEGDELLVLKDADGLFWGLQSTVYGE